MSEPWPDIGHTYNVAAERYAATFAGELDGKPFDRDLLDRYAAALAGRGQVARTKSAITVPSRSPASSCRKWPAFSMTG